MRNASEGVEGGVHACMRALSAPPSRDEGRHVAVVYLPVSCNALIREEEKSFKISKQDFKAV
jgi:hypothetical protein